MATGALEEGDPLPDVELTTPSGGRVALGSFVGRPLVLYFYPKDDTSGCTRQAQDFSRLYGEFRAAGAEVLGVSKDAPARHLKFIDKYDLTVPLASDTDDRATAAFGTWVEKQLYGKRYMGIDRSTFLFDARGRLAQSWRRVKVPGHADAVLAAVKALG